MSFGDVRSGKAEAFREIVGKFHDPNGKQLLIDVYSNGYSCLLQADPSIRVGVSSEFIDSVRELGLKVEI